MAQVPDSLPPGDDLGCAPVEQFASLRMQGELCRIISSYSGTVTRHEVLGTLEAIKHGFLKQWMDEDADPKRRGLR